MRKKTRSAAHDRWPAAVAHTVQWISKLRTSSPRDVVGKFEMTLHRSVHYLILDKSRGKRAVTGNSFTLLTLCVGAHKSTLIVDVDGMTWFISSVGSLRVQA